MPIQRSRDNFRKLIDEYVQTHQVIMLDNPWISMGLNGISSENFSINVGIGNTFYGHINSSIGAKNDKINQKLLPLLQSRSDIVAKIQKQFNGCDFIRSIHLSSAKQNLSFEIKWFGTLDEYLKSIVNLPIYRSGISKSDCIYELSDLGISQENHEMKEFLRYPRQNWDWLEYLEIYEEFDLLLPNLRETLAKLLDRHCAGIRMLDIIYSL